MTEATTTLTRAVSQGVKTNRDEWVCEFSEQQVIERTRHLIDHYNQEVSRLSGKVNQTNVANLVDYEIKWTRKLKNLLIAGRKLQIDQNRVSESFYRPFTKLHTYFAWELNEDWYQLAQMFPVGIQSNPYLAFVEGQRLDFSAIASDRLPNYAVFSLDPVQCAPLYRFDETGNRVDNITDWALNKFSDHYKPEIGKGKGARKITKEAIFHYCYAVLHDPVYREKYAQNLKREFPRIPYYANFWKWAEWGRALMDLHIGYEAVEPYALTRTDIPDEKARAVGQVPKAMLKADKVAGRIQLDSETTLSGIPPDAWDYKLGNRSALEWILDQYKEKKPKDPTIREKFDTYRFADYKENVIDLLMRVTTVSVYTVEITRQLQSASR